MSDEIDEIIDLLRINFFVSLFEKEDVSVEERNKQESLFFHHVISNLESPFQALDNSRVVFVGGSVKEVRSNSNQVGLISFIENGSTMFCGLCDDGLIVFLAEAIHVEKGTDEEMNDLDLLLSIRNTFFIDFKAFCYTFISQIFESTFSTT